MSLLDILASEPLAEELVVFGAGPVRVVLASGEIEDSPPLVPFDGALVQVITDVAMDDPSSEGGAS